MLKRGMAPVHPGRILKNNYIHPLGLTISEMAKGLGVSRKQVSSIINQRSGISPEMAVRLSEAFGTSVELWTNLQSRYDAYQAHKKVSREGIKRFYPETQAGDLG